MDDFRFEKLEIWKYSIEISDILFSYADTADGMRKYKFAEQLRAATMSISNNIAEGSGSYSDKEFANFLNVSRRSVFECANILHIFERQSIISEDDVRKTYPHLLTLSKKISSFRKTIIRNELWALRPEHYFALCHIFLALCPAPCALRFFLNNMLFICLLQHG